MFLDLENARSRAIPIMADGIKSLSSALSQMASISSVSYRDLIAIRQSMGSQGGEDGWSILTKFVVLKKRAQLRPWSELPALSRSATLDVASAAHVAIEEYGTALLPGAPTEAAS